MPGWGSGGVKELRSQKRVEKWRSGPGVQYVGDGLVALPPGIGVTGQLHMLVRGRHLGADMENEPCKPCTALVNLSVLVNF